MRSRLRSPQLPARKLRLAHFRGAARPKGESRQICPDPETAQNDAAVWYVDSYIAAIDTCQQVCDVALRRGSVLQPSPSRKFPSEQYRDNRLAPLYRIRLGPDFPNEPFTVLQTNPFVICGLVRHRLQVRSMGRDGRRAKAVRGRVADPVQHGGSPAGFGGGDGAGTVDIADFSRGCAIRPPIANPENPNRINQIRPTAAGPFILPS